MQHMPRSSHITPRPLHSMPRPPHIMPVNSRLPFQQPQHQSVGEAHVRIRGVPAVVRVKAAELRRVLAWWRQSEAAGPRGGTRTYCFVEHLHVHPGVEWGHHLQRCVWNCLPFVAHLHPALATLRVQPAAANHSTHGLSNCTNSGPRQATGRASIAVAPASRACRRTRARTAPLTCR